MSLQGTKYAYLTINKPCSFFTLITMTSFLNNNPHYMYIMTKTLMAQWQHRRCFIPQAVHSLVLLMMGEIIARNMLS